MKILPKLLFYLFTALSFRNCAQLVTAQNTSWPVHDTGLTDLVQWDHYSLMVRGERAFIWSGELHYWRIPVPEVWKDLLEKVKAAGFNTLSIYSHWAYHAPNPDTVDFETGARNFTSLLTFAKEIGLYVIFRAGPYVNAETTAGAFALWTTTGAYGALRNNDTRYTEAWMPFTTEINAILSEYQLTQGGMMLMEQLENETPSQWRGQPGGELNWPLTDYMIKLEENARGAAINIPLFTNAPNQNTRSWSKDYFNPPGAQDLYGLDSYPSCWSCNLAECNSGGNAFANVNYHAHFDLVSITQPSFIPEFQGGSYNPWGGPEGGCRNNTGVTFVNTYYRHLLAERITMISLYMLYGGTNWGGLATNLIGTSYDYSAPIEETRQIGAKYAETKLLSLFLRTARDLRQTDRVGFSFDYTTSDEIIGATELRNPVTDSAFYILAHNNTQSTTNDEFKAHIRSGKRGELTIPVFSSADGRSNIKIEGQESKVLVVDFTFGDHQLVYNTAEVLSHSIVDGQSVLALWLPEGESGEFRILGGSERRDPAARDGQAAVDFHEVDDDLVVSYTQSSSQVVLQFDDFRVILTNRDLGYRFWAPTLSNDPLVSDEDVLFVTGPYLVRGAHIDGTEVHVKGDLDAATDLEVWASESVDTIVWNGSPRETTKTSYGTLFVHLDGPKISLGSIQQTLELSGWRYSEALPEITTAYDDSSDAWVLADNTETPNPTKPRTLPVLYADDYGFHTGVQLFRGKFNGRTATGASLTVQGGTAFGFSVYLNGRFLNAFPGDKTSASANLTVSFSGTPLLDSGNVLTVVMDHSGHNQRAEALFPRGILGASLTPSSAQFTQWKIAGNAGGTSNIDPVRGTIAEGGLHAERVGWHLPGFDDSNWVEASPSDGVRNATIAFFRTTKTLNVPEGLDAAFTFVLSSPAGSLLRAQLYVNGYQYGKYVPHVGNQISFPVPPGILNYRGENTIGLNLWSQTAQGAKVDVALKVVGVYESAWDPGFDSEELRPGWSEDRLKYA